jgi:hypothetical protein
MVVSAKVQRGEGRAYVAHYFEGEKRFRDLVKTRDKSDEQKAELERLAAAVVAQGVELVDRWFDNPSEQEALDLFYLIGSYTAEAVNYWLKAKSPKLLPDVIAEMRNRRDDLISDCSTMMIQNKIERYGRKSPLHGFIFTCVQNEMWNVHNRISGQKVEIYGGADEEDDDPNARLDALNNKQGIGGPEMGLLQDFSGPELKELFFGPVGNAWKFLQETVMDFEASRKQGDQIRRLTLIQLGVIMGCPQVVSGLLLGRDGAYHAVANAGNPGAGGKPIDRQFMEFVGYRLLPQYEQDDHFRAFRHHVSERNEDFGERLHQPVILGTAFVRIFQQHHAGILFNPA